MSLLGALLVAYGALGLIALRPVIGHLAYEFGPMSYGGPAEPEWTAGVVFGVILCGLWPAALVGGALFLLVRPFRVGAERRARKEQERKVEESRIAQLERETGVTGDEAPGAGAPERSPYGEAELAWHEEQIRWHRQAQLDELWQRIKP